MGSAFEDVFLHIRRKTRLASETAAEVAGTVVTGLYSTIYDKLDPVRLGENDRAMLIARHYGERLSCGRNLLSAKAIEKLITGYPSHEFVIDFDEASELFDAVRRPNTVESALEELIRGPLTSALFDDDENSLIEYLETSDEINSHENTHNTNTTPTPNSPQGDGEASCETHGNSETTSESTEETVSEDPKE